MEAAAKGFLVASFETNIWKRTIWEANRALLSSGTFPGHIIQFMSNLVVGLSIYQMQKVLSELPNI